jgi:hypothetical protein
MTPAQLAVIRRLTAGLPPEPRADAPVAPRRVTGTEQGREGSTVLFHRWVAGQLVPDLFRVYADGRWSQH